MEAQGREGQAHSIGMAELEGVLGSLQPLQRGKLRLRDEDSPKCHIGSWQRWELNLVFLSILIPRRHALHFFRKPDVTLNVSSSYSPHPGHPRLEGAGVGP